MTERLAEVSQHIGTTRQLGEIVNAMRAIAGARAQQSRDLLPAVRAYAGITERAIEQARLLATTGRGEDPGSAASGKPGLLVFGAEQGFAGGFAEMVLDTTGAEFAGAHVFLVGSRSTALAAERGLAVGWRGELPGQASAVPQIAIELVVALYSYLGAAGAVRVAMVYPVWTVGGGVTVSRQVLLPLDPQASSVAATTASPLTNLPAADLIAQLGEEWLVAQVCAAALEAFAAENQVRMATMAAAKTNIDAKLAALQAEERRIRQEEVTAEVVELAAGARGRVRN